jgi:hypothetical protein
VPDRRLVEEVAAALGARPGLVEKDWHVVRAIGVIAGVDTAGMMPAFSGGTSLSKGWELIKRFSEDIDFKVGEPAGNSASRARRERTSYRERVLQALTGAGFELEGKASGGNESRYFSADLAYGGEFGAGQGLRPHIRGRDGVPGAGVAAGRETDPLSRCHGAKRGARSPFVPLRGPGRDGGR